MTSEKQFCGNSEKYFNPLKHELQITKKLTIQYNIILNSVNIKSSLDHADLEFCDGSCIYLHIWTLEDH